MLYTYISISRGLSYLPPPPRVTVWRLIYFVLKEKKPLKRKIYFKVTDNEPLCEISYCAVLQYSMVSI